MADTSFNVQDVLDGSTGTVWLNGIKLSEVQSIELKVAIDTEDINCVGQAGTQKKTTGWNGSGTLTLNKVHDRGITLLANAIKNSEQPDVTIITELKNKRTGEASRVSVSNIVFTEFTLASFSGKGIASEELPFTFGDYSILETIA